jgi:Tfp pilus assembly protein PilF
MKRIVSFLPLMLPIATVIPAHGQAAPRTMTAAQHVAIGDSLFTAMNASTALKHYQAALRVDSTSFDALCKAARTAVDLGEFDPNPAVRDTLFLAAEQYARRAIAAKPDDAEGHFELARAIGKRALTMGTKDKVNYAGVVHDEAMTALKFNPKHSGALHIMGVWNAEIMRLNGFSRFMAKNLLGGKTFGEASWDNAQKDLEDAVSIDPSRITHHLDLGLVYKDRDMKDKARAQFEWIANAPTVEFDDRFYKQKAAAALAELK